MRSVKIVMQTIINDTDGSTSSGVIADEISHNTVKGDVYNEENVDNDAFQIGHLKFSHMRLFQ